jgi:hypothetical protein
MTRRFGRPREASARHDLVGRDLARVRLPRGRTSRPLAALLCGALLAGMGLAALRIDILRLRYALAEAIESEQTLLEDQRVWTARKETLRDPSRLAELARERGFARPQHVIDLRPLRVAGDSR